MQYLLKIVVCFELIKLSFEYIIFYFKIKNNVPIYTSGNVL